MLNDYEIVYNKETIEALQHADSVASQMVGLNIDDVPATFRSLSSEIKLHTQHHLNNIASFEAQRHGQKHVTTNANDSKDDSKDPVYRSLNSGPPNSSTLPSLHRLLSVPRH